MKTIDSRIAQRRRSVSEDRARHRLRRLLGLLLLAALVGLGAWALRSPLLSIREISVVGAEQSSPQSAIDAVGLETGTPTISVDAGALERALVLDPWIDEAAVTVSWPGRVEIDIQEHRPVAFVATGDAWLWATGAGHAVAEVAVLPEGAAVIDIVAAVAAGEAIADAATLGALEFVGALPPELAFGTEVAIDGGELRARIDGYDVRLGRPADMTAKALALEALLATEPTPGASIDLIAPRRPAVANSQRQPEGEAKSSDTVQVVD